MQNIAIFGATGSIGGSTLDVLSHYQDRYRVFALTANSRIDVLVQLCEKHRPVIALVADEKKRTAPESGSFHGVDNGTRTHDLQSHNLTP